MCIFLVVAFLKLCTLPKLNDMYSIQYSRSTKHTHLQFNITYLRFALIFKFFNINMFASLR
jgi:hypothetical protein